MTNFLPLIQKELEKANNSIAPSTSTISKSENISISRIDIIKGNPKQFSRIVKNIKESLNKEFSLEFVINDVIDDILLINLSNIRLSTASYKPNITFALQQLLSWWGYSLGIDGIYGTNTANTVTLFEKQAGIATDGTTTKEFWMKILGK